MKVALTFDIERDIPFVLDTFMGVNSGLKKILELLDSFNIKGTFFCTGKIAEEHPTVLEEIESKGHEIACHSLNHQRLTSMSNDEIKRDILESKKKIEGRCRTTEIIGFRAPYLVPPKALFKILNDLDFKYDSSIASQKELLEYSKNVENIREFHPSKYSIYFRLPYPYLDKKLFKKELLVLYFHPWEAINMRKLIFHQTKLFGTIRNLFFRPDRWYHTGDSFLKRIKEFINKALLRKAEFIMLNQLI